LLKSTTLSREQQRWVSLIDSSGNALLNIVNDILDFSKLEAGKLKIERIPFDPARIVRECFEIFRHTQQNEAVELRCEIDDKVPPYILGDPARLRQIIINLMSNATKFTSEGQICLSITTNQLTRRLTISVADTGIGIPDEKLNTLFTAFEQTSTDIFRKFGGTGLGLSICRELAELMNGEIGVESRQGEGSRFWLEIPCDEVSVEGHQQTFRPGRLSATRQKIRVLVAEDNAVNQMVVKSMLAKLGYECDLVADGEAAVQAVKSPATNYGIVLMDCDMPVKDGYQATEEIRQFEQSAGISTVPIVALTAHVMDSFREKSLQAGMDDYLTKPLSVEQLGEAIVRATTG
ncbi:MAG: response regulator, partial [Pseudomonadales bacterium]|nr:response regulator [Pseudomonadales bacterium]